MFERAHVFFLSDLRKTSVGQFPFRSERGATLRSKKKNRNANEKKTLRSIRSLGLKIENPLIQCGKRARK